MITRTEAIDLLEAYSSFLEEQGYLDTDWRAEPPFAIDEFLKLRADLPLTNEEGS